MLDKNPEEITLKDIKAAGDEYRKNPCNHDKTLLNAYIHDQELNKDDIVKIKHQIADCTCCFVYFDDNASKQKRLEIALDKKFWKEREKEAIKIAKDIKRNEAEEDFNDLINDPSISLLSFKKKKLSYKSNSNQNAIPRFNPATVMIVLIVFAGLISLTPLRQGIINLSNQVSGGFGSITGNNTKPINPKISKIPTVTLGKPIIIEGTGFDPKNIATLYLSLTNKTIYSIKITTDKNGNFSRQLPPEIKQDEISKYWAKDELTGLITETITRK